jgi:hypothetical protein
LLWRCCMVKHETLTNKCFTFIMLGFKVICGALLFIFKLKFPPGVSIGNVCVYYWCLQKFAKLCSCICSWSFHIDEYGRVNANKKHIDILGWFNRENILDLLYVRLWSSIKLLPAVQGYFMFSDMGSTPPIFQGFIIWGDVPPI